MIVLSVILGSLSVIAALMVGWLVHMKTGKLLRRIETILIARVTSTELAQLERLIDDIERTGEKRGTIVTREDGSWGIHWAVEVGGGTLKPTGSLRGRRPKK